MRLTSIQVFTNHLFPFLRNASLSLAHFSTEMLIFFFFLNASNIESIQKGAWISLCKLQDRSDTERTEQGFSYVQRNEGRHPKLTVFGALFKKGVWVRVNQPRGTEGICKGTGLARGSAIQANYCEQNRTFSIAPELAQEADYSGSFLAIVAQTWAELMKFGSRWKHYHRNMLPQ